jgi:fibro-slime domain-containing protein
MRKLWSLALTAAMLLSLAAVGIGELSAGVAATEMSPYTEPAGLDALWGLPNGYILDDGSVLLLYTLSSLESMYAYASESGFAFDAAAAAKLLPFDKFENQEAAKADFITMYDGATLVDAVYSKLLFPGWPEERPADEADFINNSSVAYCVRRAGSEIYEFITISKSHENIDGVPVAAENFTLYVDTSDRATMVDLSVGVIVEKDAEELPAEEAGDVDNADDSEDADDSEIKEEPGDAEETEEPDETENEEKVTEEENTEPETTEEPETDEAEPTHHGEFTEEPPSSPAGANEDAPIQIPDADPESDITAPEPTVYENETATSLTDAEGEIPAEPMPEPAAIEAIPLVLDIPISPEKAEDVALTKTADNDGGIVITAEESHLFIVSVAEKAPEFEALMATAIGNTAPTDYKKVGNTKPLKVSLYDYEGMREAQSNVNGNYTYNATDRLTSHYDSFNYPLANYTTSRTNTITYQAGAPNTYFLFGNATPAGGYTNADANKVDNNNLRTGIAAKTLTKNETTKKYDFKLTSLNTYKGGSGNSAQKVNGENLFPTIIESNDATEQLLSSSGVPQNQYKRPAVPSGSALPVNSDDTTMVSAYYNYDFPFVYDKTTEKYTFDSTKYFVGFDAVSGNAQNKKLSLYTKNDNSGPGVSSSTNMGFFPFDSSLGINDNNQHNYFFGMRIDVEFYMPTSGKINNADIEYSFTGDDDVWVYIDGNLILDMGGVHTFLSGKMNLTDGTVGNATDRTFTVKTNDTHTLTIFYMERNPTYANCKMEFNIPAIPEEDPYNDTIQLMKLADTQDSSKKFGFTVYQSTAPANEKPTAKPATGGTTYTLGGVDDETITLDSGVNWVRIIENDSSATGFYTAYVNKSKNESYNNKVYNDVDTGWLSVAEAQYLMCFNRTKPYITVNKLDQTNKTLSDVEFELLKVPSGSGSPTMEKPKLSDGTTELTSFTTDTSGQFVLNGVTWAETSRLNGTYILREKNTPDGYDTAKDVTFTVDTQGYITEVAGLASVKTSGNATELYIYNVRTQGELKVHKKILKSTIIDAQGTPTFMFKVDQYDMNNNNLKKSWVQELSFPGTLDESTGDYTKTATFTGLDWDYSYKVSELTDVMRYGLNTVTVSPEEFGTVSDKVATFALTDRNVDTQVEVTFTNERMEEGYLSDTYVKTNSFGFLTPSFTVPDSGKPTTYTVTIRRAKNEGGYQTIIEPTVVANTTLLNYLYDHVSQFTAAEFSGLQAGAWQIESGGYFGLSTPITSNITITVVGTTP